MRCALCPISGQWGCPGHRDRRRYHTLVEHTPKDAAHCAEPQISARAVIKPQINQSTYIALTIFCSSSSLICSVTCIHLPVGSKWLYVGTEKGNIHVVHIDTFALSGYIINWNKAIEVWVLTVQVQHAVKAILTLSVEHAVKANLTAILTVSVEHAVKAILTAICELFIRKQFLFINILYSIVHITTGF